MYDNFNDNYKLFYFLNQNTTILKYDSIGDYYIKILLKKLSHLWGEQKLDGVDWYYKVVTPGVESTGD